MSWLDTVFRRNKEIDWMFDNDLLEDKQNRIYLKKLAIQVCVNHIADTIAQSKFIAHSDDERYNSKVNYMLNIRPNKNQNASQFWQQVIYRLINDNEALIIESDSGELLIADDFDKEAFTMFDYLFKNVIVGDYEYKRIFEMKDVYYLSYSNGRMKEIIDGLYNDYGDLFGMVLRNQMVSNQLRATFKIGTIGRKTKEEIDKQKAYIKKVVQQLENDPVAFIPLQDGQDYQEYGDRRSSRSVEEIDKSLNGFIDKVAMALKIPPSLVRGDVADTKEASRNYIRFCINPLIKQISDEFTSKMFSQREIEKNNYRLEIRAIRLTNVFEMAESIDKLVSSSVFTGNEIREALGYERSADDNLDKHIITKNYDYTDREER